MQHVTKQKRDGPFCGYRNIQMLVSYMQGAKATGHDMFSERLPGILDLQDLIEAAWDGGICENSKYETGGIRGTRKWIGTPEVSHVMASQ